MAGDINREHPMTLRLDGLVVRGEIDNTRPYSVCGWLKLRGFRTPLTLNLTGDCGPGLKGRRIRFEHPIPVDDRPDDPDSVEPSGLAWQQIGPTGTMTVSTAADGPDTVGSTPDWEPLSAAGVRLSLEWFSQNGRVTLDLDGPLIETVPDDDLDTDASDEVEADIAAMAGEDFDSDDEDPYGLFSEDLMRHFDDAADRLDREALAGEGEDEFETDLEPTFSGFSPGDPSDFADAEELEDLIENGEGVPIGNVFDPPIKLPRPEHLSEAECEAALKRLLARMAEVGISLDVCEHFTPRDAYELLLEEICPSELTHPDLEATQWVQHFSTSDFCEACEAEFEREFEEYERNRRRDEDDED